MLKQLWKKYKNSQDEKLLAEYKARDAELGTPTKETLNERAAKAAEKGLWKTAIAALDQGADVNMPLQWKQFYGTGGGGLNFENNYSLTFVAIKQNNTGALEVLLGKGADTSFVGSDSVNERIYKYSLPEYAAHNGKSESLALLLSKAKFGQKALNGALKIAAGEKSYFGMTQNLLDNGAQGYEAALRAAERNKNNKAVAAINAVKAKKPETLVAYTDSTKADALATILENASADERRKLIAGLQAKFSGDFAAVTPKAAAGADAPTSTPRPPFQSIHYPLRQKEIMVYKSP